MDPSAYYPSMFMTTTRAALSLRRGVFSQPLVNPRASSPASFLDFRSHHGPYFERAMPMPENAFWRLVNMLQPHLPSRGHAAELRTAMALRYLGGGSYLDICATFGVPASTLHNCL